MDRDLNLVWVAACDKQAVWLQRAVNKLIKHKIDFYYIIRSNLKAVEIRHSDIIKPNSDSDSASEEYEHWCGD